MEQKNPDQLNTLDTIDKATENIKKLEKDIVGTERIRGLSKKRRARLQEVRVLYFIEKKTQEDISVDLGVSRQTILKDVAYLREQATSEGSKDINLKANIVSFVWEMNNSYQRRIRMLWRDYNKATSEFVKVKLMTELREQDKQYIQFLQEFNILPKAAQKYMHAHVVYNSHLGKKPVENQGKKPEEKQEVSENEKIQDIMSVTL